MKTSRSVSVDEKLWKTVRDLAGIESPSQLVTSVFQYYVAMKNSNGKLEEFFNSQKMDEMSDSHPVDLEH